MCPICKKIINETQIQGKNYNLNTNDNNDYEEDNFELEVDDNDIFYNPLVYFISIYIIYFIALFSINHLIYIYFSK